MNATILLRRESGTNERVCIFGFYVYITLKGDRIK